MMTTRHWTWFLTLIPMKNKAEHYKRFSDFSVTNAVSTSLGWMSFLDTMARNSKRSTQELLLIHFQRPEARECKSYQEWMQAGCRVKRGALGIAVLDQKDPSQLRYLFGVTDTVENAVSWRFNRNDQQDVAAAIVSAFDIGSSSSFPSLIEYSVSSLIHKYWDDHEQTILNDVMECWKGWDPYAAKLQFLDAAFYSACYIILERCGMHPQSMYDLKDFGCVQSFNSPDAMAALGECIRSVGNQVLDVIEHTIADKSQKNKPIQAEGVALPSAFLQPKKNKKEMEVR